MFTQFLYFLSIESNRSTSDIECNTFFLQHHLEINRQGRVRKIAFVVDKNNLADQQAKVIKRFVRCRLKIVSGDSMRDEDFTDLSTLLSQYVFLYYFFSVNIYARFPI